MVVDGSGRGAVLADHYAKSPHVDRVLVVPGNDLMEHVNTHGKEVKTYPGLTTKSRKEIVDIVREEGVDLVDVAEDGAVEVGITDGVLEDGRAKVMGPTSEAGQMEYKKSFGREKGRKWGLPQPDEFYIFDDEDDAVKFLNSQPEEKSWFVKADGGALGKGALPGQNRGIAIERVREMKDFGEAGKRFLIESWITGDDGEPGEEFSEFAVFDGKMYKIVGSAQDHKLVSTFDMGNQTGGMGCVSPPLMMDAELAQSNDREIWQPVQHGFAKDGIEYKGMLYLGGMAVRERGRRRGKIVEWNARWGAPEAEVVVPRLQIDLFEMGMAVADGDISRLNIATDDVVRVIVIGASRGYPDNYDDVKNKEIHGLDEVAEMGGGVRLYPYGVAVDEETGKHYAKGGRLFGIVGEGKDVIEARARAYEAMSLVSIEGNNLHFRTDIGWRDVQRLRESA